MSSSNAYAVIFHKRCALTTEIQFPSFFPKGLKIELIYVASSWGGWIFRTTSCELSIDSRNIINLEIHPKDSQDLASYISVCV